jgi:hypothetical protein
MPNRDGLGPRGQGSRTGRGRGYYFSNDVSRRPLGQRWFCRRSNDPNDLEMRRDVLKNQLNWVEEMLSKEKNTD